MTADHDNPAPAHNAGPAAATSARGTLLADTNFRWLMGGAVLSGLGDQFTMIALPWLVLKWTGDPLAVGLVIAIMSVPRAIFILVGGALVDRYSPKPVLMGTKYVNTVVLGALAALVLLAPAMLTMPLLYGLALAMGLAQAFSYPAVTSFLPQIVPPDQLQAANGLMMGVRQLLMLAGPVLGAMLVALGGDDIHAAAGGGTGPGAKGIGMAFAYDSISFIVSAWTLAQVQCRPRTAPPGGNAILRSVAEGLKTLWRDVPLRTCFIYWAIVAMFVGGSMQVALPLLANRNLHGAAALGMLMGAHGVGTLIGMALSGAVARGRGAPAWATFGAAILCVDALVGILLLPLGAITSAWQGMMLLLIVGVLGGLMQIGVFTWIQRRVPPPMLGRAMSIFMFIFMGLGPLSAAAFGALLNVISLQALFAGGGVVLVSIAGLAWLLTPMRKVTL